MNKEIKYVDDDTILVFDEYGNYTKKPNEVNVEKKLETENKIENINQIIEKIKKQISECDNFDDVLNFILKLNLLIPIVSMPLLYTNAITPIITGLVTTFLGAGTITSVAFKKYNNKNKNGLNAKLKYANNLENQYQSELENLLSEDKISKNTNFTNEIIPIKYSNELDMNLKETMDLVYNEAYSKNKTLKKNKKHK